MSENGLTLLKVECSDYEVELNCSDEFLENGVRMTCCEEYSEVTKHAAPHVSLRAWRKCCDSLGDNGLAPAKKSDWENSSYQAYIMGVAVFGILICLFVSGARSVRRRRMMVRLQQRQQARAAEAGTLGNQSTEFCTQVSLGPPTYGELEAKGLTKDYKMGAFDPPPYPAIEEEYIQIVPSPADQSENGGSEATPPSEDDKDDKTNEDSTSSQSQSQEATGSSSFQDTVQQENSIGNPRDNAEQEERPR